MTETILELPITISDINGKPCLILKKSIIEMALIKTIVSASFHNQPLIILPKFTDKMKSINSLIQKGIVYRKPNGELFFTL